MKRVATITLTAENDDFSKLDDGPSYPVTWQITFDPPLANKEEEDNSVAAIIGFEMIRAIKEDAMDHATEVRV